MRGGLEKGREGFEDSEGKGKSRGKGLKKKELRSKKICAACLFKWATNSLNKNLQLEALLSGCCWDRESHIQRVTGTESTTDT